MLYDCNIDKSYNLFIFLIMFHYFIVYKPFKVLSQFSSVENKKTLSDIFDVPSDVYPVGRLDYDSEGLLLLTNDSSLNQKLLNPSNAHEREYWVQVEGDIHQDALQRLSKGVVINVAGTMYHTKPCKAVKFEEEPIVPVRSPPIRFRKNIPTSWIKLILTEGKNRQVRKMTATVGFPTLRLIRYRVEKLTINMLNKQSLIELRAADIQKFLKKN